MRLKITISFFFLCFLKTFSANKPAPPDTLKVIIACVINDDAKTTAIKNMLKADSTVNYIGYCSNYKVFLIECFGDQQGANDFTMKIRKQADLSDANFYIKQYQFGDILSFCDSDNYKRDKKSGK